MRINIRSYTCALLCCLLYCSAGMGQLQKIYLQPKAAGNAKQSDYIDSVRFIPLEIRDGVNPGAYNNVQVTDRYILITDYPNKQLFVYDRNGSFMAKINYKKQGEVYPSYLQETNTIVFFGTNKNYLLTARDRIQIVLDWKNPRNRKYFTKHIIDLNDTTFTVRKVTPDKFDVIGAYPYYEDFFRQISISVSDLYRDTIDHEIKLYRGTQLIKAFFPYNHVNEPKFLYNTTPLFVAFSSTDTPYINFVTRPFCDTIYKLIKDSLFPIYKLVMPLENTLPSSFFTTAFKSKTERDNFGRNNAWLLRHIYNFYETSRFIFLSVAYFGNYESYIHDKKTGSFIKTRNIKPDNSHFNLPFLNGMNVVRRRDKFYRTVRVAELRDFFRQNRNVSVPAALESLLKTEPKPDAQVLVEFKLKS